MKQATNTHYIKEEIDIDWEETDNCYGEASDNGQREVIARVVLEKLPASVLHYYVDKKRAASRAHKNEDNQDAHDSARKYTRFCEKCNKIPGGINPRKCERCSNKLLFRCSACAKLFKTHSLFVYHWSTRCGVKGYFKCTKCDFKSVWRSKIVQHMGIMHKSPNLSHEFKSIEWISLTDNSTVAQSSAYKCSKCSKRMENPVKLSLHIQSCGGLEYAKSVEISGGKNGEFRKVDPKLTLNKCSTCGKQFSHVYSLNDHIRYCKEKMEYMTKVTDEKDVEDDDTDNPSKSLISADKRYASYIKMMVRCCSKCQEDSPMEEKNRGIGSKVSCRKCETTLLFKCVKCLKESTEYKVLKYHLDTICNPKEEFKCTKCNFKSYTPKIIKEHYFTQHGIANHECKQCGSKFRTKGRLSNHMLRCGVDPMFQCEHCPFISKRKLYLKIHIFDNHMGSLVTYRRDRIRMSYQQFTQAASHLTVHCSKCKNERSLKDRLKTCRKCKTKLYFQCKTCKKNCSVDDENACDHVKSYLEAIKFECERCGRGFKSKNNLCTHHYHCAAKVTFKCRFCKYAAKYKASIKVHEKIIHLNEA